MPHTIKRISTDKPSLYAFEINGKVVVEDMESMAKTMNAAFDTHEGKVDMMLVFFDYDGSELGASLDTDVITARFRALKNVDKYVVVGAPDTAESLLKLLGKLLPVEADTFALPELDQACKLVGIPRETMNAYLTS